LGNDSITKTILKGNVGIGTTTPATILHIYNPGLGNIKILNTSGVVQDFGYDGGVDSEFWFVHTGAESGYTSFMWNDGIYYRNLLYIGNNGNVGIGTMTSTAKLHLIHPSRGEIKLLATSGVGHDFGYNGGIDSIFWFNHTGTSTGYTLFRWDDGISSRDLLYIGNNGNIGIGTLTPSQRLTVVGNIGIQAGVNAFIGTLDNYALGLRTNNTDRIFITNAGNVGIGTTTPATRLAVAGLTSSQAGRNICSDTSGNFYYYSGSGSCVSSSIKYKTNIQNLGIGLETLLKLRPVTFEFKKDYGGYDGTIHMGFIAEEVEQVTPILVDYNNGEVSGVRYSELTALIVKSIQEQQNEIKDLKKEIEELKKMITR
jgi:hypothetical protein